jgi:hypothetical protein
MDSVEAKNTKELFLVASQFCTFIENIQTFEKDQAVDYLLKISPLMYLKGSLIPEIELEDNSACEQFFTEEQYELLYLSLKEKLAEIDFFEFYNWQLNEVETRSLCEFLTDVYQDMKDFLLLYNKNTLTAQEAALFLLRENFFHRWGKIITIILPYLHQLSYPEDEKDVEW